MNLRLPLGHQDNNKYHPGNTLCSVCSHAEQWCHGHRVTELINNQRAH